MTSSRLLIPQEVQEGLVLEAEGRSLSDQVPGYWRDQNETSVLHHHLPRNRVIFLFSSNGLEQRHDLPCRLPCSFFFFGLPYPDSESKTVLSWLFFGGGEGDAGYLLQHKLFLKDVWSQERGDWPNKMIAMIDIERSCQQLSWFKKNIPFKGC